MIFLTSFAFFIFPLFFINLLFSKASRLPFQFWLSLLFVILLFHILSFLSCIMLYIHFSSYIYFLFNFFIFYLSKSFFFLIESFIFFFNSFHICLLLNFICLHVYSSFTFYVIMFCFFLCHFLLFFLLPIFIITYAIPSFYLYFL